MPEQGGLPDITKANFYGQGPDAQQELISANEAALQALQQRYENPNWFNVAAGFLKPQLGGFAASLGSASQALGENLEKQRANELPVAQQRAQLALMKNQLAQNQKAVQLETERIANKEPVTPAYVAKLLNTAPNSPQAAAAQAELTSMQKTRELESSEIGNRATQYGQALKNIELKLANKGYNSQAELDADRAQAMQLYGPKNPAEVRPPSADAVTKDGEIKKPLITGTNAAPEVSQPVAPETKSLSGVPTSAFLNATHQIENPANFPKGTGPGTAPQQGPGQFTEATLKTIAEKYPNVGNPADYGKPGKEDTTKAFDIALLGDNHAKLTSLGVDKPTALDHRLAWHFGPDSVNKLKSVDQNTPIGAVMTTKDANGSVVPDFDLLKKNNLKPSMTVRELKNLEGSKLYANGVNPDVPVAWGGQTDEAPSATSANKKQEIFPLVYADPSLTDPSFNRKTPDQQARIVKNVADKAAADEKRASDQIAKFQPYGDETIFTPYKSDLDSSIDMIENNKFAAQKVFNILGQGTLKAQIEKAIQDGVAVHGPFGSWSINLPAKTWEAAGLSPDYASYANTLATKFLHINAYKNQINNQSNNPPPVAEFTTMLAKSANLDQPWDSALKTLKIDRANAVHGNRIYTTVINERDKVDQANELAPTHSILKHSPAYKAEVAAWRKNLADLNK
jgi:hypothetical protein